MPTQPANLERLTEAANLLRAVISAHDCDDSLDYDLAPELRVVVTLIDGCQASAQPPTPKLNEAGCILKVCIVTHTEPRVWRWAQCCRDDYRTPGPCRMSAPPRHQGLTDGLAQAAPQPHDPQISPHRARTRAAHLRICVGIDRPS
jgi:hypothetical protein